MPLPKASDYDKISPDVRLSKVCYLTINYLIILAAYFCIPACLTH